ncbi:YicC family protein [Allofranklinella schreckenbergeri]|uniref:YicC family protein n=1 Tax=Allofranklinella schreckenbergeri TaxID=1076744 RepID=A0A3M6QEJ6_9BURK|nr:YicC/YloC family endoribonuclease [Allofranklinella schreckenbergeri]RMX01081.1 YicC family protein [Allofranklinella schreckenbergeri]
MAVYSMTGYASVQSHIADCALVLGVELRSVNSRFLDLIFKVPDSFKPHEARLRQIFTEQLGRGKVEVRLTIERDANDSAHSLNAAALQKLAASQDLIKTWFPDARALSVAEVLQLQQTRRGDEALEWTPAMEQALLQAIAALKSARQSEGQRLVLVLREKIEQIKALAQKAGPLIPELVEQQRCKFLERWQEALQAAQTATPGTPLDPKDLEPKAIAEATAFAIRIDIAEELARLNAHLDEIDQLLQKSAPAQAPYPIGKRLDFLIQELHREANTLGSKSALLQLSRISMDMKVLIEQMREQVQNIE